LESKSAQRISKLVTFKRKNFLFVTIPNYTSGWGLTIIATVLRLVCFWNEPILMSNLKDDDPLNKLPEKLVFYPISRFFQKHTHFRLSWYVSEE
jgi:hypothetical protein